ncbi:dihydroxyacetone kinase subunit DhaL [Lactococcus lactis]|uniref:phosphoenolpyruvate--glycerone phosphotransferase n=1 Tax=Lactococcus lactis TaxID=1358 RepID=A0AAE4T231_9LACT|nr:dihydroxyacetone kinase subunit DhaL [Lactococcus lactis]MDV2633397.1 dihydroxyacetone kinase subunit DhaL [Lactococcus lactis]
MLTIDTTIEWLGKFNEKIQENKAYLSELDGPIGDGDHGANMARGMSGTMKALEVSNFGNVSEIFKKVAMTLMSKVGGASGPLYGSAFLAMSKTATETLDTSELIYAGLEAIQKRGKAQVGEKTMVDIWSAFLNDLQTDSASKDNLEKVVKASAGLLATKGRASYLGERSIGHIDPGTQSSAYLFETLLEVVA